MLKVLEVEKQIQKLLSNNDSIFLECTVEWFEKHLAKEGSYSILGAEQHVKCNGVSLWSCNGFVEKRTCKTCVRFSLAPKKKSRSRQTVLAKCLFQNRIFKTIAEKKEHLPCKTPSLVSQTKMQWQKSHADELKKWLSPGYDKKWPENPKNAVPSYFTTSNPNFKVFLSYSDVKYHPFRKKRKQRPSRSQTAIAERKRQKNDEVYRLYSQNIQ